MHLSFVIEPLRYMFAHCALQNLSKYCHRSGIYGTQQKTLVRQRGMKLKGTNKIGLSLSSTYDREGGG
jgi:hypothetical protein